MKKLLIFMLAFTPFFFLVKPIFSQEEVSTTSEIQTVTEEAFTAQKAYQDYIYVYDLYKSSHSEYLLARSQYQQANTLASKTKAQTATVKMLQARDDVVISYLTALRLRLSESEGVSTTDRDGLYGRLDSEIAWFSDHKSQINSAGSLDDLVSDSTDAKERFMVVEPLVYEVLSTIPLGKIEILKSKISSILSEIKIKTEEIRAKGDHDTTITERWIIETENKIARGLDKQIAAQQKIYTFQQVGVDTRYKPNYSKNYEEIITLIQESNQFFREASGYMGEILTSIKTTQQL